MADQLLAEFQALVPAKRLTKVQPGLPTEVLAGCWTESTSLLDRYLAATSSALGAT